jgi:type IV pilus assembly protein PilM
MFSLAKKDIVAIDIGSSAVKLVQLREAKGTYHLVSLGIGYLPPEAIVDNSIMDSSSVVEVIRNLVESHKVKTKNVATSISGHSVIIRKIQLPIMTDEELESSIQWEAEQYIPFEISEVNLDFQILGTDPKDPSQMNVILVAAKKDFVADHVAVFKESGLTPVIMDIDCFAVENAFEVNYGFSEDEIVALVNMGASAVNVNVLKAGVSVFTRDIQVGGNLINEELQKRLGLSNEHAEKAKLGVEAISVTAEAIAEVMLDAAENLAQEVQRSLDFFAATSADEKINKIFITGGVAKIALVREAIERRIGVSVEVINPFRQVMINEKNFDLDYVDSIGPIFTVAAGLAMRRVGDK